MKKLILGLALLSATACVKEITSNTPEAPQQLVLNTLLASDSSNFITVSTTSTLLEAPEFVTDALVEISINNNPFTPVETCSYRYCLRETVKAGDLVKARTSHIDFGTLTAETTLPSKPVIKNPFFKDDFVEFTVQRSDNNNAYYMVEIIGGNRQTNLYERKIISTSDLTIELLEDSYEIFDVGSDKSIGVTCFFSSNAFNGNEKKIVLSVDTFNTNNKWVLDIRKCSEDYYLYQRSKILSSKNNGNPFRNPVPYHTNVKNGLGIVAGYNRLQLPL